MISIKAIDTIIKSQIFSPLLKYSFGLYANNSIIISNMKIPTNIILNFSWSLLSFFDIPFLSNAKTILFNIIHKKKNFWTIGCDIIT